MGLKKDTAKTEEKLGAILSKPVNRSTKERKGQFWAIDFDQGPKSHPRPKFKCYVHHEGPIAKPNPYWAPDISKA